LQQHVRSRTGDPDTELVLAPVTLAVGVEVGVADVEVLGLRPLKKSLQVLALSSAEQHLGTSDAP
jgi:hypothetical protein